MKICSKCGSQNSDNVNFCESCGAGFSETPNETNQVQNNTPIQLTKENNQGPAGGGAQQPYGPQPYNNQMPNQQQGYNNQPPMYQYPPQPASTKSPDKTGVAQIVLGVINIVMCNSLIFGIIALVMTFQARAALTDEGFDSKIKIARILNIIGLVLGVLAWIAIIAFMVYAVNEASYYDYSGLLDGYYYY